MKLQNLYIESSVANRTAYTAKVNRKGANLSRSTGTSNIVTEASSPMTRQSVTSHEQSLHNASKFSCDYSDGSFLDLLAT